MNSYLDFFFHPCKSQKFCYLETKMGVLGWLSPLMNLRMYTQSCLTGSPRNLLDELLGAPNTSGAFPTLWLY